MFAAYIPLFAAARVGLERSRSDDFRWYLCGSLIAIAVLLRETFVPFAALGAIAVLVGHGWRSCWLYVASGVGTALVVGGTMVMLRGGTTSLFAAYIDIASLYQAVGDERWEGLVRAGQISWREAGFVTLLALTALVSILVCSFLRRFKEAGRLAFWVGAAAVPLLEPIAKIGFAYHISVCLPGLCGLCALGWRLFAGAPPLGRSVLAGAILIPTIIMAWPQFGHLNGIFRSRAIPDLAAIGQDWPKASIERSNYLLLADAIRRSAPRPAVTLSSSARMLVLFPLTGMIPSAYGLEDLSQLAHRVRMDASSLRAAIRECPPDVIMLATRAGTPPVIAEALANMPEYAEVAHVPITNNRHYGGFGGIVYRRSGTPGACRRVP
jgi:hypothetical protein